MEMPAAADAEGDAAFSDVGVEPAGVDVTPVADVAPGRLELEAKDAVSPVAFLQAGGGDVALPATKLTAAHYYKSAYDYR